MSQINSVSNNYNKNIIATNDGKKYQKPDSGRKAAAAAGISWTVLNIALIWSIQSWLADIQLKSGRLGVMKALEALDDPAYYANIIPDSKAVNTHSSASSPQTEVSDQTSVIPVAPQNGSLLDKFKK